jgi:hypothetical protein
MTKQILTVFIAGLLLLFGGCTATETERVNVAKGLHSDLPELPPFLVPEDIFDAEIQCGCTKEQYAPQEQKYVDALWHETLQYLKGTAIALTTPGESTCIHSDEAVYETADGMERMCITRRADVKSVVKNIYQVLYNPDKAKACFSPRKGETANGNANIYAPTGSLYERSPVAQWLKRPSLKEFYATKVDDPEVQKFGLRFSENFSEMVTGEEIVMPVAFPFDISANALPNLWAAAGWNPMYGENDQEGRNKHNEDALRGGYAYAEVFGPWGLLRIRSINGELVGIELGMVAQADGTFYSFHNHATSEFYYTIRSPSCKEQIQSFAITRENPSLKTVRQSENGRVVRFDSSGMQWVAGSETENDLVYFYQNTIHAFDVNGECEATPEDKAFVSVWARTDAANPYAGSKSVGPYNDYGETRLCADLDNPDKPPVRGGKVRCELTQIKWQSVISD